MNAPLLTTLACLLAPIGLGQTEIELVPSDLSQFGRFGTSVALDGTRTIVGATDALTAGAITGAAFVFDRATGQQLMRLSVTDAVNGRFGHDMAIDGGRLYVSAFLRNLVDPNPANFMTRAGGVYVFDAATGQQLDFILPADVAPHIHFGQSVDVDGGLLAVGARAITAPFVEPRAVYVLDALTGQQIHKLFALDGEDEDKLGEAVAIDGGLVVSGASGDDDNGNRSGSAYVFDAMSGAQLVKLTPNDPIASHGFGVSVAIQGQHVVIGADRDNDNGTASGAAYVFEATTGQQLMKLVANDGLPNDNFGSSVAIEGGRVIVGAPQTDEQGNSSGAVYVFDLATGEQLSKIVSSNGGEQHYFGRGLAAYRDHVAVGSPFASFTSTSQGAAHLFDLDGGPNGVISYCDPLGANTVSSSGALLSSTGGFGTSNATFNITGIPNNFGLLVGGTGETNFVLGYGSLCVAGNLVRGPVLAAQGNQILGATFDMASFGSTHMQYWFRELGACPGGTNNLSNALKQ